MDITKRKDTDVIHGLVFTETTKSFIRYGKRRGIPESEARPDPVPVPKVHAILKVVRKGNNLFRIKAAFPNKNRYNPFKATYITDFSGDNLLAESGDLRSYDKRAVDRFLDRLRFLGITKVAWDKK
jgi:hypothetical protein